MCGCHDTAQEHASQQVFGPGFLRDEALAFADPRQERPGERHAAGTTHQIFGRIDLNDIALEVLGNLADRIDETQAEVAVGELPTVVGDSSQLRQVLQNLISNSLKFVEAGVVPNVRVAAEMSHGLWRISVADNGIGIEPLFHSRVFIPFRHLHTQEQFPGTGVGLSIAKRIVERHGGTMWMESPAVGGSEFVFTLPARLETGSG